MDNNSTNNQEAHKSDEMKMEQLLSLIKEQTKEIKLYKKKLEKLEEKFIKTNADLKNVLNDRLNIENFLKTIFPKEMQDNLVKSEYGLYDSGEMCKLYLVFESQKQNEFQQILNRHKNENSELTEKLKLATKELETKTKELYQLKSTSESSMDQLNYYMTNHIELNKRVELLENEKFFLVKMLDSKNEEIEKLTALEVENAELKAKSLLENLEKGNNSGNSIGISNSINLNQNYTRNFGKNLNSAQFGDGKTETINSDKIFKILTLNVGCQTTEQFYSSDYVAKLDKQINELKQKLEKTKKEFNEYKEKSHKLLMNNEENFNKMIKENENLKKEISQILNDHMNLNNNINSANNFISQNNGNRYNLVQLNKNNNLLLQHNQFSTEVNYKQRKESFKNIDNNLFYSHPEFPEFPNKVNIEYLKNVLLKYLESIAMGNEFQSKLLENVIFTILKVSKLEREALEEKRARSSFYYNLWYNAKAFLSSKLYGNLQGGENNTTFPSENSENQITSEKIKIFNIEDNIIPTDATDKQEIQNPNYVSGNN